MDEHVIQQIPPAEQIIPEELKPTASPYKNVSTDEVDVYREYVVHYFDNQMNRDILMLPQEDKFKLFQMFQDYAAVLEKIFHPGIPIFEHILGKRWAAANANPHAGINFDYDCPIIREYDIWKAEKDAAEAAQVNAEPQS
jgi:hypothetical protein